MGQPPPKAKCYHLELNRGFYPTVLIIIASYYVLFAILGGSSRALLWETVGVVAFSVVAVFGALCFPFLVGGGIAAQGIFDLLHHLIIQNPGVPSWWPTFSFSVDVLLGLWVIGLSRSRHNDLLRTSSGG